MGKSVLGKKLFAFFSLGLFSALIFGYLWWGRFQYYHGRYIFVVFAGGLFLVAANHLYHHDNLEKLGFRMDNFRRAARWYGGTTLALVDEHANLSTNATAKLDALGSQVKDVKGFLIEVRGFASSDGDDLYNIRLSQRRAELVVRYLVENLQIPLRRIVTPHGFGEMSPVAENSSLQGRRENRRVEARVLLNQGLESAHLDATHNP